MVSLAQVDRHAEDMPSCDSPVDTRWIRCYKLQTGPTQTPGWRWEPIDLGVADLVKQLQRLGPAGEPPILTTAGCCSGHRPGQLPHVLLPDGRVISLLPSMHYHIGAETGQGWHRFAIWVQRTCRRAISWAL